LIKVNDIWLFYLNKYNHRPTPNNLESNYYSSTPFNPVSLLVSYYPRRAANGSYAGAGYA